MEESYMYKDSYTIGVIIFGSVRFLSKKVTKPNLKKKTETEPKPGQTDWFRCGSIRFFREKTDSNRFGLVFSVLAWFLLGLARFFSGFFRFRFGSVWFFWFFAYKTETEPNRPVFSKF
jgi:hypothetical protein